MLVREGDRVYLEARVKAEPADDVLTRDYYTLRSQIRLTGDSTGRPTQPKTPTEVTLDGNDVARVVECALRHPSPNMRSGVLAAIWNHPELVPTDFPVRPRRAPRLSRNTQDRH